MDLSHDEIARQTAAVRKLHAKAVEDPEMMEIITTLVSGSEIYLEALRALTVAVANDYEPQDTSPALRKAMGMAGAIVLGENAAKKTTRSYIQTEARKERQN